MVFARKYRPHSLAEVVGQPVVVQTLSNAITQKKLHHAYLFIGNKGSGKTSTGRILAASENCLTSPGLNPCGNCDLCKIVFSGNHRDILEIDAASSAGKVEQIRELKTAANYSPMEGAKTKYFIIDECLPFGSLVSMADGTNLPIGMLVEQAFRGDSEIFGDKVFSRDIETGNIFQQKISRYIKIPNDKQMYLIKIRDEDGNIHSVRITGNHSVFVSEKDNIEKVKAQDLTVGKKVFVK